MYMLLIQKLIALYNVLKNERHEIIYTCNCLIHFSIFLCI